MRGTERSSRRQAEGLGVWVRHGAACAACVMLIPVSVSARNVVEPDNEMTGKVDYAEVVHDLARKLSGPKNEAMDAALKLGQLGRRAVPILAQVLEKSESDQAKYLAASALTRIRHPSAAKALLPILRDPRADRNLRLLAIGAASADDLTESVGELKKLAADPTDGDMRFVALKALSVMPTAWKDCENLFVMGLADDRDDIRQLSAKVCYQVATVKIFYYRAEPKLLELAEKGYVVHVRCNAMSALARMKSRLAVPMVIRVLANEDTPPMVAKSSLNVFQYITGVPVRDAEAAKAWWEKHGKERYANAKLMRPPLPDDKKSGTASGGGTEPPARKQLPPMEEDPNRKPFSGGVPMGE